VVRNKLGYRIAIRFLEGRRRAEQLHLETNMITRARRYRRGAGRGFSRGYLRCPTECLNPGRGL